VDNSVDAHASLSRATPILLNTWRHTSRTNAAAADLTKEAEGVPVSKGGGSAGPRWPADDARVP